MHSAALADTPEDACAAVVQAYASYHVEDEP